MEAEDSDDGRYQETPEAREALEMAFAVIQEEKEKLGFEAAIFMAMEKLNFDGGEYKGLTQERRAFIICSAVAAMDIDLDVSECHPYSESGYKLFELVKAFVFTAVCPPGWV